MSKDKMSNKDKELKVSKEKRQKEKKSLLKEKKISQGNGGKKPVMVETRWILLALAVLFFLLGGLTGAKALRGEARMEERAQYEYMLSVDAAYHVQLRPNELYPEQRMEEGRIYSSALVETVNFDFTAFYESEQRGEVSGYYSVDLRIQGYQGGETKEIVYERNFPLMSDRKVTGTDKAKIEVELPINMRPYYDFTLRAEEILDAKLARNIEVIFYGSFSADTDYGPVEEPFSYTINVPYGDGLFTLSKPASVLKQGNIGETIEVIEHPYLLLALPAVLLFLTTAALIVYFLRFTRKPTPEEQLRFDWQNILRKHGSRMIRMEGLSLFLQKEVKGEVFDLASLIKMADELRVPIYYALGDKGMPALGTLYLEDREQIYFWKMIASTVEASEIQE